MSRKRTKQPEKSEKAENNEKTDQPMTAPPALTTTPATRALRFLLGRDQTVLPKEHEDLAENPDLERSSITITSEIEEVTSSTGASSIGASSESQLQSKDLETIKLRKSQVVESQLTESQLPENLPSPLPTRKIVNQSGQAHHFEAEGLNINWRIVEHTRIPQQVFDEILPQLAPMAQTPYLQLLRLTLGFQRANCHISLEAWAARCNQSLASIKRQAAYLMQRGLLLKENVVYGGVARGSYYRPVIPAILNDERMKKTTSKLYSSQLSTSQLQESQLTENYMKEIDHEDLRNIKDHHQRRVMTIYKELTGNKPSKADLFAYKKVAHLDADTIEIQMRQIYERSVDKIGSFAYFTKGLLAAKDDSYKTKAAQKRSLEKIVERIKTNHIGGRATLADLIEDIKRACVRDNVIYNNDIVNEILGIR
ncbi:MAG: hypothetical protein JNN15_05045 [Blastocatellia bacterium]|nr:hypothetical protein [Blastocatellia bacterium]